ncbi:MAG: Cytochrome c oxidase assembly protein cox11, mitochondrial [Cirrosporium novae-zelandiae]|nr:MAG: Cytochrome c oxidase assembly protein cox11, mitochondrial [Cirrosporium novae-zelandiae]
MSAPRSLLSRNLLRSQSSWLCTSCARRSLARKPNLPALERSISSNPNPPSNGSPKDAAARSDLHQQQHHQPPTWEELRAPFKEKNRTGLYYTLSIILGTVALSYGSVPLYKMICQTTGWGGQPIKSSTHTSSPDRLSPVTDAPRLRITFNGSVSDVLPWKFIPQQREVRVLPGETALAFYTATNKSPTDDIIGVATYSVTPGQVAPYFSKIQCFCFEEQRLNAGETVDMPVFFFIDPEFSKDPNMKGIETITLSYTFFSELQDPRSFLSPPDGMFLKAPFWA